jgi:hypothetical protein
MLTLIQNRIRMGYMKKTLNLVLSYFPSRLPVGVTEFKAFVADILLLTGPMADEDSMIWAIANQIIHLPPQTSHKPKQYFVRSLRKAAANQVASSVFHDIKLKQQRAAEESAATQNKVADTDVQVLQDKRV